MTPDAPTPPGDPPADNSADEDEAFIRLLCDVRDELRRLSHPAFEAKLLEHLRGELLRQNVTTGDLRSLLRELHHDLQWLKKHVGELWRVLEARGIPVGEVRPEPKDG